MTHRRVAAASLREYVACVFARLGYPHDRAGDAADVLLWASLRGVDTHGVRNLKPYYVDRTLTGILDPAALFRIERETPHSACLDGGSGLGLACASQAMRLAIDKCHQSGVAMVCVRNTHHLGPAGYFAHMAVEHGMLGLCMTGHFFGQGHAIGIAPLGSATPMFSTNPLSFAAPCGRHAPFVLDMSTAVATVNRVEMYAQEGRAIPEGWALDAAGLPTTDPAAVQALLPLGGAPELGGYKGAGLAMMVSVLSGVLSGAWSAVPAGMVSSNAGDSLRQEYDQATMGHWFAAIRIEAIQPLEQFRAAMDAMIDAFHTTPTSVANRPATYAGELEHATAVERLKTGVPVDERLWMELAGVARQLDVEMPELCMPG